MTYEDFVRTWTMSLQASPLCTMGLPVEHIEPRTMQRTFEQQVESTTRELEPFLVSARFSFRWSPVESARSFTSEHDLMRELVGVQKAEKLATAERLLRVDVALRAATPYGHEVPMPSRDALAGWTAEVTLRLNELERLIPRETSRINSEGKTEVLAGLDRWPSLQTQTRDDGSMVLASAEIHAWQLLSLPRRVDRPRRRDQHPAEQLDAMFARVDGALKAWREACIFLRPRPRRRGPMH